MCTIISDFLHLVIIFYFRRPFPISRCIFGSLVQTLDDIDTATFSGDAAAVTAFINTILDLISGLATGNIEIVTFTDLETARRHLRHNPDTHFKEQGYGNPQHPSFYEGTPDTHFKEHGYGNPQHPSFYEGTGWGLWRDGGGSVDSAAMGTYAVETEISSSAKPGSKTEAGAGTEAEAEAEAEAKAETLLPDLGHSGGSSIEQQYLMFPDPYPNRRLQTPQIDINFDLVFIVEQLGYADADEAFTEITLLLEDAINSGEFDTLLQSNAQGTSAATTLIGVTASAVDTVFVSAEDVTPDDDGGSSGGGSSSGGSGSSSSGGGVSSFSAWPLYAQVLLPLGLVLLAVVVVLVVAVLVLGVNLWEFCGAVGCGCCGEPSSFASKGDCCAMSMEAGACCDCCADGIFGLGEGGGRGGILCGVCCATGACSACCGRGCGHRRKDEEDEEEDDEDEISGDPLTLATRYFSP